MRLLWLVLVLLVAARVGLADDDLAPEVYGDPGQKLAPPPKKREPRYKPELIKSPKVELADARAKIRELSEKLTDRSINHTARTALNKEIAVEAEKIRTITAQLAAAEAEEVKRAIADEKADQARRDKEDEDSRKEDAAKDAKEAAKDAADARNRRGSYDGPGPVAARPAASPAPEASPSPAPSPAQ